MESLGPPESFPSTLRALAHSKLAKERAALEREQADLLRRRDLAQRRLAAHNNSTQQSPTPDGKPAVWLSAPRDIANIRALLEHQPTDETLTALAAEVRDKKDELTQQALEFYARRCDEEAFPTGVTK